MRNIWLALVILISVAPSHAAEDLIQNGGFEEIAGGFPTGWVPFQGGQEGASFEGVPDRSIFYEGNVSIRLTNLQEGSLAGIRQNLELPPGHYKLSCYVRTEEKGALFSMGAGSLPITVQSHAEVGLPIWVDNVEVKMIPIILDETIYNAELDSWDNIRVQLPTIAYSDSLHRRYPVLVVTHGLGGDRNWAFSSDFGPEGNEGYRDLCEEKGWILASADLGGTSHWGNDSALSHQMNLIQYVIDNYRGDPDRIYVHGASMGGGTALLTCENLASRIIRIDGEPRTFLPAACAVTYGWTNLTRIWEDGLFRDTIEGAYGANPEEDPWIYYIHSPTEFPGEPLPYTGLHRA